MSAQIHYFLSTAVSEEQRHWKLSWVVDSWPDMTDSIDSFVITRTHQEMR